MLPNSLCAIHYWIFYLLNKLNCNEHLMNLSQIHCSILKCALVLKNKSQQIPESDLWGLQVHLPAQNSKSRIFTDMSFFPIRMGRKSKNTSLRAGIKRMGPDCPQRCPASGKGTRAKSAMQEVPCEMRKNVFAGDRALQQTVQRGCGVSSKDI